MRRILTKSNYLSGLECPKYLWMIFNQPEKKRKMTLADEYKMKEGQIVGEFAKQLYPDGVNIPVTDHTETLKKTKEFMKKKRVLFEAGFQAKNCFSRVDILVPVGDEWDLIEVKSSKRVKDINIHDVAFQKHMIEASGVKIRRCFLLHLSNEYVRKGVLEVEKLYVKEDITSEVDSILAETERRIGNMFSTISLKKVPKAGIFLPKVIKDGVHNCCNDGCLDLPEKHVFSLYRGKKLAAELYEKNIKQLKEIPEDYKLTDKQRIQRKCEIEGKTHLN